ncbi:MAG: hemolysin family protein [Planctomycetota bacterium]
MTFLLLFAAVSVSLGISAICSLLEAALLSLTPGQVGELKRTRPVIGEIWETFKKNVEKPISVILICNTAAHTIGATVAGAEFERLMELYGYQGGWTVFAFGAVFTVLMLQFTEILPKTMGVKYNTTVATISGRPMRFLVWAMGPVLAAIRFVNKPFEGGGGHGHGTSVTVDEIATLAAIAKGGAVIDAQQERMIRTAGKLGDIRVREIMTHRKDVRFLRLNDDFATILQTLRDAPYTRLPIVDGSLDTILGVVHLRDVFNVLALVPGRMHLQPNPDKPDELMAIPSDKPGGEMHAIGTGAVDLKAIMRPMPFVPDTQPIDALLKQFQTGDSHMAAAVNEYGAVEGIVTLEDVLEELVGDIEDEFDDRDGASELEERNGVWHATGDIALRDVAEKLALPEDVFDDAGVVTLGGWLTHELSRWPKVGDTVPVADRTVRVAKIEGKTLHVVIEQPIADAGE